MRILVLDDEDQLRNIAVTSLQRAAPGVEIRATDNGRAALELLSKEHYDAILTDYKMPTMMGTEFVQRVFQLLPSPPPILMLSGNPEAEDLLKALNLPNTYFHVKPYRVSDILDFLQRLK